MLNRIRNRCIFAATTLPAIGPDGEEVTSLIDQSDFPTVEHLVVLRTPETGHDLPASADDSRSAPASAQGLVSQAAFAPLMLELMAKAHRVAVVDDAPTVMVELHRGAQAVVLVDYPQAPATAELIAAVTRYYPRVSLWQAQADVHHSSSTLSRIVSTASVSATSQPHMMLDDAHDHTTAHEPRHIGGTTALVSDEELAMLMSPFDDDHER